LHPHPPCAPSVPAVHQGLMRSARAAEQGVLRAGGDGRLRHHALSDDGGGAPPTMMPPGGTAVDGACGGCWRALRARGAWGRRDRESTWSSRPSCSRRSLQAVRFKPGPPPLPLLLAVGTGRRTGAAGGRSRPRGRQADEGARGHLTRWVGAQRPPGSPCVTAQEARFRSPRRPQPRWHRRALMGIPQCTV